MNDGIHAANPTMDGANNICTTFWRRDISDTKQITMQSIRRHRSSGGKHLCARFAPPRLR
jgi:hypothetical protein